MYCNHEICITTLFFITKYWGGTKDIMSPRPPHKLGPWLCILNTLLHFVLCQSCRSLRYISLGGSPIPFPGLIKRFYQGWLSMMTSSQGPLFSLASGSPNPKATTGRVMFSYGCVERVSVTEVKQL